MMFDFDFDYTDSRLNDKYYYHYCFTKSGKLLNKTSIELYSNIFELGFGKTYNKNESKIISIFESYFSKKHFNIKVNILNKSERFYKLLEIKHKSIKNFYAYINYSNLLTLVFDNEKESIELAELIKTEFDIFKDYLENKNKKDYNEAKINLILKGEYGLNLGLHKLSFNSKNFDLDKSYNTEFISNQKNMIDDLKEKKSGLHILYGLPGCGKTTFIKYMTTLDELQDKKILYLSPEMTSFLADPGFLKFLLNNAKNSILIVEDSENVICKNSNSSAISNIRNITDGIIGDILNLQIIATFNGIKQDIDEALLRPGRLLTVHELKELEVDKANVLLEELGKDKVTEPIRISDIYNNVNEQTDIVKNKKIGF